MTVSDPAVIIHGGAGDEEEHKPERKEALAAALDAAWSSIHNSEPGEIAVVRALKILEACQYFDAGYGGYPNEKGQVRLDCALMLGSGEFISVVNVRRIKHPSALALKHLKTGRPLMLAWTQDHVSGIDQASQEYKDEIGWVATEEEMVSPYALLRADEYKKTLQAKKQGTVGCVVRDESGKIFAGTSTGGTMLKPHGRVGDSPVIGAGVYADDKICGLSATGHGESFLGAMTSAFIIAEMRGALRYNPKAFINDKSLLNNIIDSELTNMNEKYAKGQGGVIVIPAVGEPTYRFNTPEMAVALRIGNKGKIKREEVAVHNR